MPLHCLVQWLHLVSWALVPHVTADTDHSQSSGANGLVFQAEGLAVSVVLFAKIKQMYNKCITLTATQVAQLYLICASCCVQCLYEMNNCSTQNANICMYYLNTSLIYFNPYGLQVHTYKKATTDLGHACLFDNLIR